MVEGVVVKRTFASTRALRLSAYFSALGVSELVQELVQLQMQALLQSPSQHLGFPHLTQPLLQ